MALVKISGPVSNFQQETEITRAVSHGGAGNSSTTNFQQKKVLNFRVGNKPVTMVLGKTIDLGEGDPATVVGTDSSGIINAVAVRNDVTGIRYARYGAITLFIWAAILVVLGILLISAYIGLVMIPMGLWLGYKGLQVKKAFALIDASPPDQGSDTA